MPRYIDRDTALSHPFANGQYDKENANEHFIFGFEGYKEWLEQLPTVDAVEVVRCKDCRYCTTNTTVMTTQTLVHCNAHRIMTAWDGWCYKGERR